MPVTGHGQFEGLKLITHPPNLNEWREKLFHVDDTVTLTEDEYVCHLLIPREYGSH
jgi:glutathione S-transferase